MRSINEKAAKILRAKAKELASQRIDLHGRKTYTEIDRPVETLIGKFSRIQVVLTGGWQFVYRRLKAAVRRGELRVYRGQVLVVPPPKSFWIIQEAVR